MTQKKALRALFVALAAAFILFPSCKTTETEHVPAPVPAQYGTIEATAPANQVDVLLFNDFHGTVAEDARPGKGKNAGMVYREERWYPPLYREERWSPPCRNRSGWAKCNKQNSYTRRYHRNGLLRIL